MKIKTTVFVLLSTIASNLIASGVGAEDVQFAPYTPEETAALESIRNLIGEDVTPDYMRSDGYLIRWLRNSGLDPNAAHIKFRAALKWRKDNNVDHILEEVPVKDIVRNANFYIDGVDNDGSPILTADWSHLDIRRFILSGRRNDILRYFIRMWETAERKIQEVRSTTDKSASQVVAIFDIKDYNLRQHACLTCFGVLLEYTRYITNFYPGIIKDLYLINAPRSFSRFSELLKPAIPQARRDIFKIYSFDRNEWVPLVLKNIQPDQLRPQFGGTKQSN